MATMALLVTSAVMTPLHQVSRGLKSCVAFTLPPFNLCPFYLCFFYLCLLLLPGLMLLLPNLLLLLPNLLLLLPDLLLLLLGTLAAGLPLPRTCWPLSPPGPPLARTPSPCYGRCNWPPMCPPLPNVHGIQEPYFCYIHVIFMLFMLFSCFIHALLLLKFSN